MLAIVKIRVLVDPWSWSRFKSFLMLGNSLGETFIDGSVMSRHVLWLLRDEALSSSTIRLQVVQNYDNVDDVYVHYYSNIIPTFACQMIFLLYPRQSYQIVSVGATLERR